MIDPFSARKTFDTGAGRAAMYSLASLEEAGLTQVEQLPYSIRVLLEAVLRNCDGFQVMEADVKALAGWQPKGLGNISVAFKPARVILQDFTGVPAVVDLAAMRDAMKRLGGDPKRINPLIPVDLVIDHSVQVDSYGSPDSLSINTNLEFQRNRERYEFLRWGQKSFANFSVLPPALGIIHQVNLEYLAKGVVLRDDKYGTVAFPDTLVGTDSHTPMINGLGVLGWGVGGIEAEAVMLGEPLGMLAPEVVGFELVGELKPGATATDIVLAVTQILRREGVVGKFVEYFGEAVARMGVADRALVSNMSPEYGATVGFFPTDERTLEYLRLSGRDEAQVQLVERYCKEQQLFRGATAPLPRYTRQLRLDLGTVEPSMAGPKRPQDRVLLKDMKSSFHHSLTAPHADRGFELTESNLAQTAEVAGMAGGDGRIGHGAVVIAAITSCTNTSNPDVMLAAGLLAKKAVERGLRVPPHVKTSLAPGSLVVTDYYAKTGLDKPLEALGFHTVGYGCTTCIGNSGPLPEPVAEAITQGKLIAASVLSGNRNFEGRISPMVKANYLAGPPLVVAYALAGTVDRDLLTEPLGRGSDGRDVFLRDVWPTPDEVRAVAAEAVDAEMFRRRYTTVYDANPTWNAIEVDGSELFPWSDASTYIQEPPFLLDLPASPMPISPISGARVLAILGDSVTTDHISPAGAIGPNSPAGLYLQERGVEPKDFNSFGSRRGNDRVMTRGTFGNIRIRNQLAPGTEGGVTRHLPDGRPMSIFAAAMAYREEGVPLVVLAGAEYGSGSSRDWAAKGTQLLGVRAVIAQSYERIHRSNLVGMGVLPLRFNEGDSWQSLGLTGEEIFDLPDLNDQLTPGQQLTVRATGADGSVKKFSVRACIDTAVELAYYRHGGILPYVLRKLA